ncbi:MAG: DNA mismatch repair endonuclease MutL, partial [Proteocatella sp.]
ISNSTVQEVIDFGSRKGTTIYVRDIFKNIPARRKFLKTTVKENNSIIDIVNRLAIINSNIKFKLISDGKVLLSTEGDGSLLNAVRVVYGKNVSTNLVELCYKDENVSIFGYVSNTSLYASNRKKQNVFVNKRYIKLGTLNYSIEGAYKEIIPIGKYPIFILDIEINPQMIDPNVHPAKTEVKIDSEMNLEKLVGVLVREKLFKSSHNLIPEYTAPENKIPAHIAIESASSPNESQGYTSPKREFSEYTAPKEHSFSTELARENSEMNFSKQNLFVYNESEVAELNEELKEEKVERHEEKKLDEVEIPFSKMLQEMTHKEEVKSAEPKAEIVKIEPPAQIQVSEFSKDSQALQSFEALKPKAEEILDYNEFFVSGVVFETYILATYKDNMYLIDQHAAHERVMYEKFMKQYNLNKYSPEASFESQELLIPIIKELTMDEYSIVIEHLDVFKLFGIEVDDFGFGKIVMRSLPLIFSEAQTEAFVDEIIDIISSES